MDVTEKLEIDPVLIDKPISEPSGTYTVLANVPENSLIDEAGMAQAFGVAGRTIRRMVTRGELPPPIRFAGRAVWVAGRVISWIQEMAECLENDARKNFEKIRHLGA